MSGRAGFARAPAASTSIAAMNPLQFELDRLFGLGASSTGTRALVLELTQPAGWDAAVRGLEGRAVRPRPSGAGHRGVGRRCAAAVVLPGVAGRARCRRTLPAGRCTRVTCRNSARRCVRLLADAAGLPRRARRCRPAPIAGRPSWRPTWRRSSPTRRGWTSRPTSDGQAALLRALEPMRPAAFDAACRQLGVADQAAPRATAPPRPPVDCLRAPKAGPASPTRCASSRAS